MFKTSTTKGRSFTLGAVLLLGTLAMPSSRTLAKPADFMLDPAHTYITFFVSHVGYADTAGMFLESSGSLRYDEETQQLLNAEISVNTASVFTNHEERDKHLRSADFLNSSEFPKMTFVATKAERLSQTEGRITGDLTLLGVTKPITLEMTLNKSGSYPFGDGHYAIGIDATGEFKRSEFGMTYGVDSNIVGDEIKLVIGLEAIRQ